MRHTVGMTTKQAGTEARMIQPADLIDAQSAADLLGLAKTTVTRRAKAGTLDTVAQLPNGTWIFDALDIRKAAKA